jgi:hypothetical protein
VLLDRFDLDQRFKGTIQALILQYRPPVAGQRTAGGAKQETLTCHRAIIRRQPHKRREGKGGEEFDAPDMQGLDPRRFDLRGGWSSRL